MIPYKIIRGLLSCAKVTYFVLGKVRIIAV